MKPEIEFWNAIRPLFQDMHLDPLRVENVAWIGTPDVNYAHGWIELKVVSKWPTRPKTRVPIEWRRGQAAWLMKRWKAKGLAFVLVRVDRDLMLFSGWTARALARGLKRAEMEAEVLWTLKTEGNYKALDQILRGAVDEMAPPLRAKYYRMMACVAAPDMAKKLGWPIETLVAAELGSDQTDDLLAEWEN